MNEWMDDVCPIVDFAGIVVLCIVVCNVVVCIALVPIVLGVVFSNF